MDLQRMRYLAGAAALMFSQLIAAPRASAAEGDVGPVYVERVSVIAIASGGHQAGNLELQIKGGFTVPSGMNCDSNYITTLKSVDADRRLFALASIAQITKQPVYLRITDDPTYRAFDGRCSLVWVSLAPAP
jgi:hypothetical protein